MDQRAVRGQFPLQKQAAAADVSAELQQRMTYQAELQQQAMTWASKPPRPADSQGQQMTEWRMPAS
jgi:hypothetical protein